MIGSLIYYALYPLTKLIGRLIELTWKGNPGHPVFINGEEVWDGGGAPFRRCSEQQTGLLAQWNSTGSDPLEKPKSANQERGDAEGLVESRPVLEIREVVVDEEKKVPEEVLLQKDTENKVLSMNPNEPDLKSSHQGTSFASVTEKINSDQPGDTNKENITSRKENDCLNIVLCKKDEVFSMVETEMFSTIEWAEMQGLAAVGSKEELFSQEEEKSEEMQTVEEVVQSGDKNPNIEGSEYQVNESSCVFNLKMLLEDSHEQSLHNFTQLQSVPPTWHFPVDVGFSETLYCPSVQYPGMSYYPAFQENNNCEVMLRVWEDFSENDDSTPAKATTNPQTKFDFTVMSYNILAQDLLEANSDLYLHCVEGILAWEKRFHTILNELQTWEPDIVCLQEVQENHFVEQMLPVLIEMGYSCVYKCRTGTKTDGCALCFREDRFKQLSVSLLEFRRSDCDLLDRDNVGIVLLLQPISGPDQDLKFSPVCVANTHLLFNPRRGDVKLAQLAIVLAEIDSVVKQCKTDGCGCGVILCGDFNSLPNMPLYQLIVTGQLYYHGLPTWMVSGQEDLSYKIHHRRLYAPLWPSSLGISDNCQYFSVCEPHTKESGKLQYNHDFLRQLRYCEAACERPPDLELIPGVTDHKLTPEEKQQFTSSFRNTICHGLNFSSVYSPHLEGTERSAVTTLHSEGAAMVDYIFYSTGQDSNGDHKDGKNGLKLLGRLALLSEADLWSLNGLPNEMFPSDHLSLLAKFQLG